MHTLLKLFVLIFIVLVVLALGAVAVQAACVLFLIWLLIEGATFD